MGAAPSPRTPGDSGNSPRSDGAAAPDHGPLAASRAGRLTTAGAAVLIALVAVALRAWRLGWGLDGGTRHLGFPDEIISWMPYIRDFTPLTCASFDQPIPNYPTLYGYVLAFAVRALEAVGLVQVADPLHPLMNPAPGAVLVGRAASAAAGLATVAMTWAAARRFVSARAGSKAAARTGLMAAALAAAVPFDVWYSHLVSPDVLLTTLMSAAAFLSLGVAAGAPAAVVFAAGAFAGAAAATKYTGLAAAAVVAWGVGEAAVKNRSAALFVRLGAVALAGFAATLALGCPPCVLHPGRVVASMQFLHGVSVSLTDDLHNNIVVPTLGWYAKPFVFPLVASLPYVMGWPLYALGAAGVAAALRRRDVVDRVLLAALVPTFAVMGGQVMAYPRYLLPLVPPLVLLATRALDGWSRRGLAVAAAAAVFAFSAVSSASGVARFSLDQQRAVATWIAADASRRGVARPRVGVPGFPMDYFRLEAPMAAAGLAPMPLADGHWLDSGLDYLVLPRWYEIAVERDMPTGPAAADLEALRTGRSALVEAASWRSDWFPSALHTRIDPAYEADLWQGEIGFTVFAAPADPAARPNAAGAASSRDSREDRP